MTRIQKYLTLGIIALMMVILNSEANVMGPNLERIEREFGVTDSNIGFMMLLFTVVGAVVSLLWGYFADKASRKLLFLLSILIGEIPCALTAFAQDYPTFFTLRILSGIGLGASFPLVFAIIGDLFEEKDRPSASGVISVAIAIGNIVGGLVGFVGGEGDWRLPFLVASLPNLAVVAVFWFFTPESKAAASEEATAELVASGLVYPKRIRLSDYAGLFSTRTNLWLLFQGIAGTVPWGSFFYIQKYLGSAEGKGLAPAAAFTVYLVFGLGMVAGNVLGGQWGGALYKRDPRLVPLFCAATTFVGALAVIYVVLWAPANLVLLSILGFVAACLAAMTGPNTKTMLLDVNAPEHRGAIFSIFNITDSVGTGIGRWVAGLLSTALGSLAVSLAICSGFWIFCTACMVVAAGVFTLDLEALRARMRAVAAEMRAGAKTGASGA
jgi:predicted MFS family arabinose efflux permease